MGDPIDEAHPEITATFMASILVIGIIATAVLCGVKKYQCSPPVNERPKPVASTSVAPLEAPDPAESIVLQPSKTQNPVLVISNCELIVIGDTFAIPHLDEKQWKVLARIYPTTNYNVVFFGK